MAAPTIRQLESIADLRRATSAWNDLWQRSAAPRPTARAEQLAVWHDCFVPGQAFRALVVQRDGQFVAALPWITSRRWGIPLASSLGNAWSPGSELLLDPTCNVESVCADLIGALQRRAPGLVSLDGLVYESQANRALRSQLDNSNVARVSRRRFTAPLIQLDSSWSAYLTARSRNFRRQLKVIAGRADELGDITFQRCEQLSPTEVRPVLQACFELEAAGWKGRQGTAVLNDARAAEFYFRQAEELARCGQIAIALIRHTGRIVAYEYGWQSGGMRGVLKIGYDEGLAKLSPGQLLRARLLEQLCAENEVQWIDFIGPTTRATSQWATHSYEVGRTLAALGSRTARAALAAYRAIGRLRRPPAQQAPTEPAARAILPARHPAPEPATFARAASDLDNPAGEI